MYYIKKNHTIAPAHAELIQGFRKSGPHWSKEDIRDIESLCEIYHVLWWMGYDDGCGKTDAQLTALRDMLRCPLAMSYRTAAQVFKTGLRKGGGTQMMLANLYEEVIPGTESQFGIDARCQGHMNGTFQSQ